MSGWYAVAPLIVAVAAAAATTLAHAAPRTQRALSLGGAFALLLAAVALMDAVWRGGMIVVQSSNWAAPFGITLAVDTFGAVMTLIAAITGAACLTFAILRSRSATAAPGSTRSAMCCCSACAAPSSPGICSTSTSGSR